MTWVDTLARAIAGAQASDRAGGPIPMAEALEQARVRARGTHDAGNKLMFVGNGGSAGIASHMAIDYSKNGGLRALAFGDSAALTCVSNDLGYERVYAEQIGWHARPGDVLIAISSSGRSANILAASEAGRERGCAIVTLSGFAPDNPLRSTGDLNFYVASPDYGFVEIAHLALLHAALDFETGLRTDI